MAVAMGIRSIKNIDLSWEDGRLDGMIVSLAAAEPAVLQVGSKSDCPLDDLGLFFDDVT